MKVDCNRCPTLSVSCPVCTLCQTVGMTPTDMTFPCLFPGTHFRLVQHRSQANFKSGFSIPAEYQRPGRVTRRPYERDHHFPPRFPSSAYITLKVTKTRWKNFQAPMKLLGNFWPLIMACRSRGVDIDNFVDRCILLKVSSWPETGKLFLLKSRIPSGVIK